MVTELRRLLEQPEAAQQEAGYLHTVREIHQQPQTWVDTAKNVAELRPLLNKALSGIETICLTGSGSSEYAGDCIAPALRQDLKRPVQVLGGGTLLTHGATFLSPKRPALMISLARSGNSPESAEAVRFLLETEPSVRHLVITCNAQGRLATVHTGHPDVFVATLDDRTNDRSLVMTSSFTNMVVAALFLGLLKDVPAYTKTAGKLSQAGRFLLDNHTDAIAGIARGGFRRAFYLASAPAYGAARESALKMTEMTGGRVMTVAETFLGLRHGPMSAIHADTLVICYLSSDPLVRSYETDLIRELNRKSLGAAKLLVGENVPADVLHASDVALEVPGLGEIGDRYAPVLYVMVGQLLGLFRSVAEGLKPDAPSESGVINRVVESFTIHRLDGVSR
ncbi:MAG: SIS domain-containing protein [Bryobacteraceae bacterium]|nr:SIS domain-containing protein [Bryobacterales bacterium]MEB2360308.1 SIS domain-containing protein [Bryobacterales bacterium]NUM99549.1 SIS domain-containing protein [Bryobacteraceae bacterium]